MTGALAAAFAPSALARDVTWPGVIGPHSRGAGWFQEGKGMPRQRWTWWVQGLAVCFSGRPRGELAHEDGRHAGRQEGPGRCGESRRTPLLRGEPPAEAGSPLHTGCWVRSLLSCSLKPSPGSCGLLPRAPALTVVRGVRRGGAMSGGEASKV